MPYDEAIPEDPLELVGISVPATADSMREMAYTFAEEFALMGYDAARLMKMFRGPRYAGAHRAHQVLGDDEVRRIVEECVSAFGGIRVVVRDAAREENGS